LLSLVVLRDVEYDRAE